MKICDFNHAEITYNERVFKGGYWVDANCPACELIARIGALDEEIRALCFESSAAAASRSMNDTP